MFGTPPTVDDPFQKLEQSAAVLRTFGIDERVMMDAATEGKRLRSDYGEAVERLINQRAFSSGAQGMRICRSPGEGYVLQLSFNHRLWKPAMETRDGAHAALEELVEKFRSDYINIVNSNSDQFQIHAYDPQ